jgi:NitT/TauT family transport system permease protein
MSAIDRRVPAQAATVSAPAGLIGGRLSRSTAASRLRGVLRSALPPLIVLVIILAAWFAASEILLAPNRRFLLPRPDEVLRVGILDPDNLSAIVTGLVATAGVALVGLAIATVLGIGVAIAMSQARWVERSLFPWAVVLQTVPILAVVPLIGFWFGFDFPSRVFVCVLIALFPIITNTLFGLTSVDRGHRDLFALHGASRRQRLLKLQLPGALPAIFTGLRIAAGLSVIGAIVGDFFFRQGDPGIGRLIDQYTSRLQSPQLFAAVVASSLLGLAVFWAFGLLGRLATGSWHDSLHDDIS